jgi:acetyl esterase/lipase
MRGSWSLALAVVLCSACSGTQLLNNLSLRTGYEVVRDLTFDAKTGLKLDVYTPPGADKAPVVVFFFPGRWSKGDKADYFFVARGLTSRGIVAVLPNYRLYPGVRFPSFVEDAAQAMKWARLHVADYGGDPDRIFVMGHSSGAHLAAMIALAPEFLAGVGEDRRWLRGMIGLAGAYDFLPAPDADLRDMFGPPERFAQTQPIHYADGTNPPLLLLHGRDDGAVEVGNTIRLASAVRSAGGPVQEVLYPRLNHGLIVAALASYERVRNGPLDQVERFVHLPADPLRLSR